MYALRLFQEVPDTELSYLLFGLIGLFIIVIIVGSLTNRGNNRALTKPEPETRKTPRKSKSSSSRKNLK